METKEQVLRILEDNREQYISGQKLAEVIGVSRNAVWKSINALRGDGYDILATTNRGYALSQENDLMSPQSIEHFLAPEHPFALTVRKQVDSTNAEARRRAFEGAPEGTVIVAEEQTAGRGRRGKTFFSPAKTGIYLSILLRPTIQADSAQYLTTAAAVACAQAIECVAKKEASIKWVNDIYCDGRKVAGILTEGTMDMESGCLEHAVVGIGINVKPPTNGFPSSITKTAGTICETSAGAVRSKLVAETLIRFWNLYENLFEQEFYDEYRRRCFLLGEPIVVTHEGSRIRARAVDLTKDFKLVIELPDKTRRELPYGEACLHT